MTFTVAHVNVAKAYRGGERQTELLIRELARRGFRQILVARDGAPLMKRFADTDVDVRPVSGGLIQTFRATSGADIVHVHEGRSVYAAWLRYLRSATPYLATRRVDNRIGDHFFAHRAYRAASFVVGVAPQVTAIVRAYDDAIRVATIHSSASALRSDPAVVAALRNEYRASILVGNIGALDNDQKGQEFLISLARRYVDAEPRVKILLVGDGEDAEMLKAAAEGLDNVVFTGFVENVGDYLGAFDIFVLPSRREGIGSILLDAMEYSLPIVATRVGGVPAIVRDGYNGYLVAPESVDELEGAIGRLLADAALRDEMGRRGREVARDYTAETMARKYLELYRRSIGGSGDAPTD